MKLIITIFLLLVLLYLLNFNLNFDNTKKINKLKKKLNFLIEKLKTEYPIHNGIQNLNNKIIIKSIPYYKNKTAYTYNKNVIYICLEDNENELFFILLHELSHIITETEGHDNTYWDNFKLLLNMSIKLNLYKYKNYKTNPINYCGKLIDNTPL
tara:strand:+ start:470 stop:931 length:462 start_codon:yes stop_codon:yes gene_type:complete